jgi:photosystem II stability/assembly factor-like uncharacterized protein
VNSGLPVFYAGTYIVIGQLVIDPQSPGTVYAVTSRGLFKSTDGGASWAAPNIWLPATAVGPLAIDPQNPSTVYMGGSRGVFKSTDGGASWAAVNFGLPATGVGPLAVDPQNPSTVYAGTYGHGVFKITFAPDDAAGGVKHAANR